MTERRRTNAAAYRAGFDFTVVSLNHRVVVVVCCFWQSDFIGGILSSLIYLMFMVVLAIFLAYLINLW